ncbi:MAG: hypothetical protein V8T37_02985 [Streptococcus sp.]
MRFILGPLCLVVYPTYFVSTERAVVRTGILLYDPRGQNDPRNRALDDQLDRLRVDFTKLARESSSH